MFNDDRDDSYLDDDPDDGSHNDNEDSSNDDSSHDDDHDDPVDVDQALCEQGCASSYTLVQTFLQFEYHNMLKNYQHSGILDHKEYRHYHHPTHLSRHSYNLKIIILFQIITIAKMQRPNNIHNHLCLGRK